MIKSKEQMVQEVDENQMNTWSINDIYEAGYTDGLQDAQEEFDRQVKEWITRLCKEFNCSENDIKQILK